jgi:RNA polymerase sigma factor (sigma-70 family)
MDAISRATDMPTSQMTQTIQHLRRAVLWRDGAGLSDGQLLEHFIERRDEAAFETLVRRHGPMVLGVCRRLLRNGHDADDAFQATFLVLVRKAASIAPKEMVGHWLYGVAYQTALKGRAVAAKRRMREKQLALVPEPENKSHDLWDELQSVLDQELSRLPYKYRAPFVLCDLEGKAYKEAARQLGWPEGTLSVRLARARKMLGKRLTRHGFAITGAALAAVLSQNAASACLPPSLMSSTIKAVGLSAAGQVVAASVVSGEVAALTKGVLHAMLLTKVKTTMAVVLTISMVALGGGAFTYYALAGEKPEPKDQQEEAQATGKQVDGSADNKNVAQTDEEKLQGIWKLVRLEAFGTVFGADKLSEVGDLGIRGNRLYNLNPYAPRVSVLTSTEGSFPITVGLKRWHGTFELDSSKMPKRITMSDDDGLYTAAIVLNGIYSLDRDELRLCLGSSETPSEFKADRRSGFILATFKREESAEAQRKYQHFYAGGFQSMRGFEFRGSGPEDEVQLLGEWVGKDSDGVSFTLIFGPKNYSLFQSEDDRLFSGTYSVDLKQTPRHLDFHWTAPPRRFKTGEFRTILEFKDMNELRIELTNEDKARPKEFTGNSAVLVRRRSVVGSKDASNNDKEKMQGRWILVDKVVDGEKTDVAGSDGVNVHDNIMIMPFDEVSPVSFKLDTTKKPKQITLIIKSLGTDAKINGIYWVDGDDLQFCFANQGEDAPPPKDFVSKPGSGHKLFILKRLKPPSVEKKQSKVSMPGLDSPVALDFGFPIIKAPADDKQPFKDGGDFIFLNSLEYQVPIKANDQQQFKFWTGFFGH